MGFLRIDPWDWPRWTLKDFYLAYEGYKKVNIIDPWERARAISFYSVAPHTKLKRWSDLFTIPSEKSIKRKVSIIRKMTEEEKKEFESIKNG